MSFQTLPAEFESERTKRILQRCTRLLLPLAVGMLMLTTTGCSMVMGIFGPTDSAAVVGEERTNVETRTLLATPVRQGTGDLARANQIATPGPTPTPFIMRPNEVNDDDNLARDEIGQSAPEFDTQPTLYVMLEGDAVNVRNAPSLDSQILGTFPRDTQFEFVAETDGAEWIQVCCVDNQLAWVYGDLASIGSGSATTGQGATAVAQGVTTLADRSQNSGQGENSQANTIQNRVTGLAANGSMPELAVLTGAETATQYVAQEAGFALTLPPAWIVLAEESGTAEGNLSQIAEDNAQIATVLEERLGTLGDVPVALVAFDLAPSSLSRGYPTNVNVLTQPVPAGLPLEFVVQLSSEQLERILGLSNAAESTGLVLPAGEAVVLDYQLDTQIAARQYYLLHKQLLYIVTFTTTVADFQATGGANFQEIMQSFRFID